jgi:RNA polymerase sigma-70 factor (sigma-E family)
VLVVKPADSEAFSEYVAGRAQGLMRTAYLLTGDLHQAEDLVQTVLAKLFLHWPRASQTEHLDAYVRRMMVNTHISMRRRRWWWERPTEELPEQPQTGFAGMIEDRTLLRQALATLPPRQRAVVVLRHYEGLSEQETADTLGCAVGTVKSLSSRGLRRLRDYLTEQGVRTAGYLP